MASKGQCVPPLPFKAIIFWPSKLGGQGENGCYFSPIPSTNLLNIQTRVWYVLFRPTPHPSFLFQRESYPFIIYKTPKHNLRAGRNKICDGKDSWRYICWQHLRGRHCQSLARHYPSFKEITGWNLSVAMAYLPILCYSNIWWETVHEQKLQSILKSSG